MPDLDTVLAWRGKAVVDRDGEKAGTLGALYLYYDDRPAYGGVQTGLFRRRESMVPLGGARILDDDVQVPYTLEQIRSAPNVDIDVNLTDDEQDQLAAHYGEPTQILAGHDGPEAEMTRSEDEFTFGVAPAKPANASACANTPSSSTSRRPCPSAAKTFASSTTRRPKARSSTSKTPDSAS